MPNTYQPELKGPSILSAEIFEWLRDHPEQASPDQFHAVADAFIAQLSKSIHRDLETCLRYDEFNFSSMESAMNHCIDIFKGWGGIR